MPGINRAAIGTKIICTLGPASSSVEIITKMIIAGLDAVRLNFSHGSHDEHRKIIDHVRKAASACKEPIPIILDLQGPKIRIGPLKTPTVELKPNNAVTISVDNSPGDEEKLSTSYKNLPRDVRKGDRILIDDGRIELKVLDTRETGVLCRVVTGGIFGPFKGINLPGVTVSAASLTDKDKEDLMFGFENDVDYVALSFVRQAHDIAMLRDFIMESGPRGRTIPIIAKIEKAEAITDIAAILAETDAIMVARGDLGVELPTEDVPVLQKMIARKCNELGKPVIIATQMLESMINSPRPTRAEASDVANAVLDGADAVMLSGETAVGRYPVQTVEVMERIISKTEQQQKNTAFDPDWVPFTHEYDPLTRSACLLADYLKSTAIIALTHSGTTATHVAKFRPRARIIAVTDREKIMRRLNLVWGIRGLIVENLKKDTDVAFSMIRDELLSQEFIKRGDVVVIVAGLPLFEGRPTNTIRVDTV